MPRLRRPTSGRHPPPWTSHFRGLAVAFFLRVQYRKRGPRAQDRDDAEVQDTAGPLDFFPPHSPWPVVTALGAVVLALGIVYGLWLALIGFGVLAAAVLGLVLQYAGRDAQRSSSPGGERLSVLRRPPRRPVASTTSLEAAAASIPGGPRRGTRGAGAPAPPEQAALAPRPQGPTASSVRPGEASAADAPSPRPPPAARAPAPATPGRPLGEGDGAAQEGDAEHPGQQVDRDVEDMAGVVKPRSRSTLRSNGPTPNRSARVVARRPAQWASSRLTQRSKKG
ncbi:cytochrome c oxidase subunit 4 [Streptomyces sp. DHE17-7]|nr:cytochrome c oxidase subunit 4 [Streptomyces sp. DHE17-7]